MLRIRVMKVLMITLAWTLLAAGLVIHDHLAYVAFAGNVPEYSFGRALASSVVAALIGAPLAATLVIFVIKERLRRRSLAVVVLAHTLTYVTVTATLTALGNLAYYAQSLERPVTDPATFEAALAWFFGPWTLKTLLFWTVVAAITTPTPCCRGTWSPCSRPRRTFASPRSKRSNCAARPRRRRFSDWRPALRLLGREERHGPPPSYRQGPACFARRSAPAARLRPPDERQVVAGAPIVP